MDRIIGFVLICSSAAAFGTLAIFGRYAFAAGMDALTILFLRFSLSALVIAGLLVVRREHLPRGRALLWPVGMGAIGYVGQAFCYLTALKYASAGLVALLLFLYPAIVAVLSAVVLRERISDIKILAIGLAVLGTALTVRPEGGQVIGVVLALTAALIYSVYIIVGSQVLRKLSAVQSSAIIFASAGVTSGVLMILNGPRMPVGHDGWAPIAGIVLIATVLPVVSFLAGLERVGPTNAATLSALEPVVTVALAALLFGETLKPPALLGGGLILAAVVLLTRSELAAPERSPAGN